MRQVSRNCPVPTVSYERFLNQRVLVLGNVKGQQRQMLRSSGSRHRIENGLVKECPEEQMLCLFQFEYLLDLFCERQLKNCLGTFGGDAFTAPPMFKPARHVSYPQLLRILIRAASCINSSRAEAAAVLFDLASG